MIASLVYEIELTKEEKFARVFVDEDPGGRFLVRFKEIEDIIDNPEAIRKYLGLPYTPTHIAEVFVPSGTRLVAGRIGPQPNFGLDSISGFQYQLLDVIKSENFKNIRSLDELKSIKVMKP